MTDDIRHIAQAVLDDLERTPKALIRAARKGIVAAVGYPGEGSYVLRRVTDSLGQHIRLEFWPGQAKNGATDFHTWDLPTALQARAAKLLDSL